MESTVQLLGFGGWTPRSRPARVLAARRASSTVRTTRTPPADPRERAVSVLSRMTGGSVHFDEPSRRQDTSCFHPEQSFPQHSLSDFSPARAAPGQPEDADTRREARISEVFIPWPGKRFGSVVHRPESLTASQDSVAPPRSQQVRGPINPSGPHTTSAWHGKTLSAIDEQRNPQ